MNFLSTKFVLSVFFVCKFCENLNTHFENFKTVIVDVNLNRNPNFIVMIIIRPFFNSGSRGMDPGHLSTTRRRKDVDTKLNWWDWCGLSHLTWIPSRPSPLCHQDAFPPIQASIVPKPDLQPRMLILAGGPGGGVLGCKQGFS